MKRILISLLLLIPLFSYIKAEERNLLMSQTSREDLRESMVKDRSWVNLPLYTDRRGWDSIMGSSKEFFIAEGEKALNHTWQRVLATDYLDYERTGMRRNMEVAFRANNDAIAALLLAELAEGQGRFLDQLINGIYVTAEMTTWSLSAHVKHQPSKRSIQAYDFPVIDLEAGETGNLMAWTHYFMQPALDKVDPEISRRMRYELKRRILDQYLNVDTWKWDYSRKPRKGSLNNWTPWCMSNILLVSMLIEDDANRLADTLFYTMKGVDMYLNTLNGDGACDEGPTYWDHGAGKLLDYLELISLVTNGKVSINDNEMLKLMGEYIADAYVGDDWVVNYADAYAKTNVDPHLVYRYADYVNSDYLRGFAGYLRNNRNSPTLERDMTRTIFALKVHDKLQNTKASYNHKKSVYYPRTQFYCMANNDGIFLSAKGGTNGERHNHNDVGNFIMWSNNIPLLIDAGKTVYTKDTFSKNRYKIWTMQSGWHNLPTINGVDQREGGAFKAKDVNCNNTHFEADIAGAYPEDAEVNRWKRSIDVKNRDIKICEIFDLKSVKAPNLLHFLTWGDTQIVKPGIIRMNVLGQRCDLIYDPKVLSASIEKVTIDDIELNEVWGDSISRITMTDLDQKKKGEYRYTLKILEE